MTGNILVVAPHPDDESIGLGGTIRKHATNNEIVSVLFLTSGELGIPGEEPSDVVAIREAEARAACEELHAYHTIFWREPDGAFFPGPVEQHRFRQLLVEIEPKIVYVPHWHDDHPDHRAANDLVRLVLLGGVPEVLQYEVWTPLQTFDVVVDIDGYNNFEKAAAIRAHASQQARQDFALAAFHLALYRGTMHGPPGCSAAEVFQRMKL